MKSNPKIMITQELNLEAPGEYFPNANPDCVYYANQRLMVIPGYSIVADDDIGNYDRLVVAVAELVECLPDVYTRTISTKVEFDEELRMRDWYGLDEVTNSLFEKNPYGSFCGIAFYLNSRNNYVQTCGDGKPRLYSRFEPLNKSVSENDFDKSRVEIETLKDPLGREIKRTLYYHEWRMVAGSRVFDWEYLDAVKFEVVGGEEVAK